MSYSTSSYSTIKQETAFTNKKALLIGLNYPGTNMPLSGCINDVKNMSDFLKSMGWDCETMTDDKQKVNRTDILQGLLKLILSGAREIYFHYSGHGTQSKDFNMDERDGMDEALVPSDYLKNLVTDDELRGVLSCAQKHQTVYMVLDCCHSGTGCDLAYCLYSRYNNPKYCQMVRENKLPETAANIICISGCQDDQTSADAYINNESQGAMSYSLKQCYTNDITWGELVNKMRNLLKQKGYTQIPNLTTGKWLSLDSRLRL